MDTNPSRESAHQVSLYFMPCNYCRVHSTLRVTPAMEAGLTGTTTRDAVRFDATGGSSL